MKNFKRFAALLLAVVMVAALAACGQKPVEPTKGTEQPTQATEKDSEPVETEPAETTTEEVELEPIKIGHIVDLTGNEATTGEAARDSLQFALDCFGGKIAGHPVEIIVKDAGGDAATAANLAQELVEKEEVVAIFGPTQAGEKASVAEYAKNAGIPVFFYNGSPAYLYTANDWLIAVGGGNPQLTVLADYCIKELNYKKVNVITIDNVGFQTFTGAFTNTFQKLGGEVGSEQYGSFATADWSPFLTSMDTSADAIMSWLTGSTAINFWKNWYQTGVYEKTPVTAVMDSAFVVDFILYALNNIDPKIADAVCGTIAPTLYNYDVDTPENNEFVELWKAGHDGAIPTNNLNGQCYQALLVFKEALEANNGDIDPDTLLEKILAVDTNGPCGHISFEESHAATRDVYITKVVNNGGVFSLEIIGKYADVKPEGLDEEGAVYEFEKR